VTSTVRGKSSVPQRGRTKLVNDLADKPVIIDPSEETATIGLILVRPADKYGFVNVTVRDQYANVGRGNDGKLLSHLSEMDIREILILGPRTRRRLAEVLLRGLPK